MGVFVVICDGAWRLTVFAVCTRIFFMYQKNETRVRKRRRVRRHTRRRRTPNSLSTVQLPSQLAGFIRERRVNTTEFRAANGELNFSQVVAEGGQLSPPTSLESRQVLDWIRQFVRTPGSPSARDGVQTVQRLSRESRYTQDQHNAQYNRGGAVLPPRIEPRGDVAPGAEEEDSTALQPSWLQIAQQMMAWTGLSGDNNQTSIVGAQGSVPNRLRVDHADSEADGTDESKRAQVTRNTAINLRAVNPYDMFWSTLFYPAAILQWGIVFADRLVTDAMIELYDV